MNDYQRYERRRRRERALTAVLAWTLVFLGGGLIAFGAWLALVGFMATFG